MGWQTKYTDVCDMQRVHCAHGFRTSFLTLTQEFFGAGVAVAADRHLGHTLVAFLIRVRASTLPRRMRPMA